MIRIGGYRALIGRLPTGRGPWWVAGGILASCAPCTYLTSWASKCALPGGCVRTAQAAAEQVCQLRGYVPWRQVASAPSAPSADWADRTLHAGPAANAATTPRPPLRGHHCAASPLRGITTARPPLRGITTTSDARCPTGCASDATRPHEVGSSAHDEVAPDVPRHPPARNRRSPSDPAGRASPRTRGPRGGRAHQRRAAPVDDHAAAVATAAGPPRPVGRQGPGNDTDPPTYRTSGTRRSRSMASHVWRTWSSAGSNEQAMVRTSPASALR